jgi:tetratricopeptide (TPR) repeat protein
VQLYQEACSLRDKQAFGPAAAKFQEAIRVGYHDVALCHNEMGQCYEELGDLKRAVDEFNTAVRKDGSVALYWCEPRARLVIHQPVSCWLAGWPWVWPVGRPVSLRYHTAPPLCISTAPPQRHQVQPGESPLQARRGERGVHGTGGSDQAGTRRPAEGEPKIAKADGGASCAPHPPDR